MLNFAGSKANQDSLAERPTGKTSHSVRTGGLPENLSVDVEEQEILLDRGHGNDGADITDGHVANGAVKIIEALGHASHVESLNAVVVGGEQDRSSVSADSEPTDVGPVAFCPLFVSLQCVAAQDPRISSTDQSRTGRNEVQVTERTDGCDFSHQLLLCIEDERRLIFQTDGDDIAKRSTGEAADRRVEIQCPFHIQGTVEPASLVLGKLDQSPVGGVAPVDSGDAGEIAGLFQASSLTVEQVQLPGGPSEGDVLGFSPEAHGEQRRA